MKLFDIRQVSARVVFWMHNIRYLTRKHYMLSVFLLLLVMITVFALVFVNQKRALERKENMLKSFYVDPGLETAMDDAGSTGKRQEEVLITVHVCGEVASPGVYEVAEGSRIIDVVELAGGGTGCACLDYLNLAREVFDGQRVYVPSSEEVTWGILQDNGSTGTYSQREDGLMPVININSASRGQLESLPGIGPVTAANIIGHRERYGPFESIEDLMEVSGIGPKKFEHIKELIDV